VGGAAATCSASAGTGCGIQTQNNRRAYFRCTNEECRNSATAGVIRELARRWLDQLPKDHHALAAQATAGYRRRRGRRWSGRTSVSKNFPISVPQVPKDLDGSSSEKPLVFRGFRIFREFVLRAVSAGILMAAKDLRRMCRIYYNYDLLT
jgi:hypothetical protein